jgi:gliding motility-associated-like protein
MKAQVIITVAGKGTTGKSGDGGPATAAALNNPTGIALDKIGNLLIADQQNNLIRKVDVSTGIITTIAGGGAYPGDGKPATQAGLYGPTGVAVDQAGNIIIVEEYGAIIRRIDAGTGIISTIAGIPGAGFSYSGDGGLATKAGFYLPTGAVVDASGNIYIADWENNVIREIDASTGIIHTAVGFYPGYTGYAGDGGPANRASLYECPRIKLDHAGNLLIGDQSNNVIRKVDIATGIIHTVAGTGIAGYTGDGGPARTARLALPAGAVEDANGNLYITDSYNNVIREIDAVTGIIHTIAGNGAQGYSGDGGPPLSASFSRPVDMAFDASGNLYIADAHNNVIRKIIFCTSGIPAVSITQSPATLCTSNPSFTAVPVNGGASPVYQWQLNGQNVGTNSPTYAATNVSYGATVTCTLTNGAACGPSQAVSNPVVVTGALTANLIDNRAGCAGDTLRVRASNPLAQITWYNATNAVGTATATSVAAGVTVASGLNFPLGIFVDGAGNVYVADNGVDRVEKWAPGATSGVIVAEGLDQPSAVFVDALGYLYVSDMGQNRVQKYPPGSTASTPGVTVAGGNGAGPAANQLNNPRALFVDATGNLYVVDQYNERVQKFPPGSTSATSGVTVAGRPTALGNPIGIFLDAAGNMYICENGYAEITKWAPGATSGVVVAGGNGVGSAPNQLYAPGFIYVDANGNIFIADEMNNRIQEWAPGATSGVTVAGGNGAGTAANQISYPDGVWVDNAGNVYASDLTKNSVQKWTLRTIDTTFITSTPGTYTATILGEGGCTMTTNAIDVKPAVTPTVSINASAISVCADAPVTFTASASKGGPTPAYQWKINGGNTGTNSAVFTSNSLHDQDIVTCQLTSDADCAKPVTTGSNSIVMDVSPVGAASVSITASSHEACSGAAVDFLAVPANAGNNPVFTWTVNGTPAGNNSPSYSSSTLADGDKIVCSITSSAPCLSTSTASSNAIPMTIHPSTDPALTVQANAATICAGDPADFTATLGNKIENPVYQWQVNGATEGGDASKFESSALQNGDVVVCRVTGNAGCSAGNSTDIVMTVNPVPHIDPMPAIFLPAGQEITLNPQVTGDITAYSWSPGAWLSDSTILDPAASPVKTTVYTLTVRTNGGCTASGTEKVEVYGKLRLPDAFTPNGDGKNDIFYVLGGPPGSVVKDLSVYNRWGQKIFQVHNVLPADPSVGWNGMIDGAPAPGGTYVYYLAMRFADGSQQLIKGTVVLVR